MNVQKNIPMHAVNVKSSRFLQINNCSLQTRTNGFKVNRCNGWKDYQLLLITNGECIAYHNDTKYSLTDGNVLIYAPGEPQKYMFTGECTSLWVHFSGTAVHEILKSCFLKSGVYPIKPDKQLRDLFFSLIQQFNHEKTAKYADATLIEILCHISDNAFSSISTAIPKGIAKAADYITQNYHENITIDELARISGYSKSRFSSLFKQYMDKTPIDYQRSFRMSSAKDLLVSTTLTISEIASACGYTDALYFSRIFRKTFHVSPSQYRES